jgi:Ca2+-binding EF-hand superfamily protein
MMDTNHDLTITMDEFKVFLELKKYALPEDEPGLLAEIFEEFDENKNDTIDMDELVRKLSNLLCLAFD